MTGRHGAVGCDAWRPEGIVQAHRFEGDGADPVVGAKRGRADHERKKDGERQSMNRRLFMQLVVFDVPPGKSQAETGAELVP